MNRMKNRSATKNQPLSIVNNDMAKYSNVDKASMKRTFVSIPTELFILINNLQSDKNAVHPTKTKTIKGETKPLYLRFSTHETRYLQTVIGFADGFKIPYSTMVKFTGMYDSDITNAKNDLIEKGFLTEDKKKLIINYEFMYELYDSLYAKQDDEDKAYSDLLHHENSENDNIPHDNIATYPTGMQSTTTSCDSSLLHIIEDKEKREKDIDISPADAGVTQASACVSKISQHQKDIRKELVLYLSKVFYLSPPLGTNEKMQKILIDDVLNEKQIDIEQLYKLYLTYLPEFANHPYYNGTPKRMFEKFIEKIDKAV